MAGGHQALYAGHRGKLLFLEHSQVHSLTVFMDNCFCKQLRWKNKQTNPQNQQEPLNKNKTQKSKKERNQKKLRTLPHQIFNTGE